ncbi:MAG: FAD-dependent oxidoreductase [Desulfobacterota bacterium]|nr:FAD-dependent oxidoreductase [Thermodesulfobacteriota bacterium]
MTTSDKPTGAVLVVGGGIGGIQTSLDLAESGLKVYLLEKRMSIGGTMAQLDKTFPTNDCSMCIMSPKLVDAGRHRNIEILTNARVERVEGGPGHFRVHIHKKARYVTLEDCKACGECAKVCPIKIPNDYEQGLVTRAAIYQLFAQAMPSAYGIEKRGEPPCRAACPIHVNAQGYIALISAGKFEEALALVRAKNPFPGITGRICTHPCETACRRGEVEQPIAIDGLKRFVADLEIEDKTDLSVPPENGKKVAIVGSGPAGLLAAWDLRKKGYGVTIFEALPVAGGMLAVGIPEYRLPRAVLNKEIDYLRRMGVEIRLNTPVGKNLTLRGLKEQGYEAIFIATGAHVSRKLGLPGEEASGVLHAVDFLRKVALGQPVQVGERVVVIGGGNAAIDAARTVYRLGAKEVTIAYRRTRNEMPAQAEEIEEAEHEGIRIEYLTAPVSLLVENGRIKGVQCQRMTLGEPDESGRARPVPVPGSEFVLPADTLIPAISQEPDLSFLDPEDGIKTSRWGTIEADPLTLQTSVEWVFAGGDAVTGPQTYIDAMAAGRKAALSIDRYLKGEDLRKDREGEGPQKDYILVDIDGVEYRPRAPMRSIPLGERRSFAEVNLGLADAEAAIEEAKRCLQCAGCSECLECLKACEAKAIDHRMRDERLEIEVGAIVLSPGFEEFDPSIKSEYGYKRFPNVVTSIEFERFLSASGPFKGEVRRPSDGKHPKKVAWIQCVGSRDPHIGKGYCSSVCCMYATKEAVIAKEHAPELEATIFFMDMRAYGKDFDKYIERAKRDYGVRYIRSRISHLREAPETRNLILQYETEDGAMASEEFDLVVLSVGLEPAREHRELAEVFGVELDPFGFVKTDAYSPLLTSRPGIYVSGAFSGPKDVPETVAQASGAAAEASSLLAPARGELVTEKEFVPERNVNYEGPRIGVFICHCGINIGGVVDVPAVVQYARTLPHVVYVAENLYTCSQDTQEAIKKAIEEHRLNRIVVASCTPRTHEPLFQDTIRQAGLNRYLFEMANIRDQCSWVHMHQPEEATEKAKDLVRMAVAKAALLEPLSTQMVEMNQKALVIGGGLSGMAAALKIAESGFEVYLVEKEPQLGGKATKIHYLLDRDDLQSFLERMIRQVEKNPKIHLYKGTTIEKVEGFVGNFKTTVRNGEGTSVIDHGVVIVATGADEHRPRSYLYGQDPRVITQKELEERIALSPGSLRSLKNVVMIQCVESRNEERPFCSRVCCSEAIKNALKLKSICPEVNLYILYRDIRTYGLKETYYEKAREEGVLFIRYEPERPPKVEKGDEGVSVTVHEAILHDDLLIEADLLVLSPGMEAPREENERLSKMLKVPLNPDGFFLEAHMKLRPVDFATEGVYLAGLAHGPKSIEESLAQANAAVSRALTLLTKKQLETIGTVSEVNERTCVGCGLCESLCPYQAIEVVSKRTIVGEKRVAQVNKVLCKGCGVCTASCRSGSIDLKGFSTEEIFSQIVQLAAS